MVTKYVRKLAFVMMKLITLILLNVQAYDLCPISFCPSSPPIQLSYSSELDEAIGSMRTCLEEKVKACESIEETGILFDFEHISCIRVGFLHCMDDHIVHDPAMGPLIRNCIRLNCYSRPKAVELITSHFNGDYVKCLLACFEHVKKHRDRIYTQNP